ncbi:MAG: N-acetyltransferase [Sedimentisphaerales bacterium]|nr:N-acetyltransferase [Sedimentisphaerales bacterium]
MNPTGPELLIRPETPADIAAITEITRLAFENHPFSRNTEPFIILGLRAAQALTVSLVADIDGAVVGHIAFSPVTFTDGSKNWFGLGPVSVRPDYQRQGIGSRLVREGLRLLKDAGAAGCILVGDPHFYERFGFKSPEGLSHEGVPQENFLALPFGGRIPQGIVEFHPAFGATE